MSYDFYTRATSHEHLLMLLRRGNAIPPQPLHNQAADHIEALAARVAKLEEALTWYEDFDPDAVEAIKAKVEALDAIRALAPSREGEGKE